MMPYQSGFGDFEDRLRALSAHGDPLEKLSMTVDIAIPTFGYKCHISVDRGNGIIGGGLTSAAAAHDRPHLRAGLDRS